jgi:hypothetical protein
MDRWGWEYPNERWIVTLRDREGTHHAGWTMRKKQIRGLRKQKVKKERGKERERESLDVTV